MNKNKELVYDRAFYYALYGNNQAMVNMINLLEYEDKKRLVLAVLNIVEATQQLVPPGTRTEINNMMRDIIKTHSISTEVTSVEEPDIDYTLVDKVYKDQMSKSFLRKLAYQGKNFISNIYSRRKV